MFIILWLSFELTIGQSDWLTLFELTLIVGVSNGLCEHASSAFIFASMSSDQFSHLSSEHFVNFWPAGISLY